MEEEKEVIVVVNDDNKEDSIHLGEGSCQDGVWDKEGVPRIESCC